MTQPRDEHGRFITPPWVEDDDTIIDADIIEDTQPSTDLVVAATAGELAVPGDTIEDTFLRWGVEKQVNTMISTHRKMPMVARTPEFRAAIADELEALVTAYDQRLEWVADVVS